MLVYEVNGKMVEETETELRTEEITVKYFHVKESEQMAVKIYTERRAGRKRDSFDRPWKQVISRLPVGSCNSTHHTRSGLEGEVVETLGRNGACPGLESDALRRRDLEAPGEGLEQQ